jgi:type I restriction enzyme R subunit
MCYNFEFLKKHKLYNSFTDACIEAEKSLVVSYSTTAILTRRALELAVKWVYSYDEDLTVPYQDNLSSLIHNYSFKGVIDIKLFPMLKYIQKLGNNAVHTNVNISREQAILALRNLYEFISWIDYSYSDELHDQVFDESILHDSIVQKKTRKELQDLYEKLGSKDKKLEEIMKVNEELRKQMTAKREQNEKQREFIASDISEFKTRKLYIDLELQSVGWKIGSDCIEEVEVKGMPNNQNLGYVDYVLYGNDGKPLAVVEAKRTSKDPRVGKQQAKLYADCLEKEHGFRPIIFYTNGYEYYLWDDKSYPERLVSGIYSKIELEWLVYKRANKKILQSVVINDAITDRAYQKMAIQAVCDTFQKGHRKALLVMATGSGKTRTAISLVDVLQTKGWVKNVLFLADRTALVRQAKKNFKNLLPNLSLCNLLDSKDNPESRMIFSTYPTMMNAIDDTKSKDGNKLFTSGHFDLIIVDESHRSIYKKYQAIFDYFDAALIGLTATPKSDIDINTYEIFDLENNVPTFAYELGEAIEEGYLNPYSTIESTLKFMEEGIHYDQLSEEEKEAFEETFDDDVKDISGEELNKFLFNADTVDKVLENLMEKGIKVEGGDKLGKTIIFAKNKKHAQFIIERFNKLYPEYKDGFVKPVYTDINYIDSVIDEFSTKEKMPQIAVSVDMLDTGIDIPELVNLVFFKKVRSKSKFWQMIGRGTRLCPDLFGIDIDKEEFLIFDYCSNFEYFRVNKKGKEAKLVKTLTENIFNLKTGIVKELQNLDYQTEEYTAHRNGIVNEQVIAIQMIDETKFNNRLKLQYIHKFNHDKAWESLSDVDVREIEEQIASLVMPTTDDELAKRFDHLMFTIEYAYLKGLQATKPKMRVVTTADKLATKATIPQVKRQEELIRKVQTDEFWNEADVFDYEVVREAFRELIKFLEREHKQTYYTNFTDEILSIKSSPGEYSVNDLRSYRKKVNAYLHEHQEDIVVYKLRNNKELVKDDIKHLEKILWKDLGTKEDYINEFGDKPLLALVSSLVGLDVNAANTAFSKFLYDESLNSNQMAFVKLIVDHVIKNGLLDKHVLNEHPFNQYGNVVHLFGDKMNVAKGIIGKIDEINGRIEVG